MKAIENHTRHPGVYDVVTTVDPTSYIGVVTFASKESDRVEHIDLGTERKIVWTTTWECFSHFFRVVED